MSERGQATVEWVGLMLGVALMFGALLAGGREAAKGKSATGLGEAVAERMVCAARGKCGAGSGGGAAGAALGGAPGSALGGAPGAGFADSAGRLRDRPAPGLRARSPRRPFPARPGSRPVPPRRADLPALRRPAGLPGPLRRLPGTVVKRGWILCLGYRHWQYEQEHPPAPGEGMPLRDTAKVVNECVNPLSFLFG
jgi:hypothetical protein